MIFLSVTSAATTREKEKEEGKNERKSYAILSFF